MNLLYTGYDLTNSKRIEYTPSILFQTTFNQKNALQCSEIEIKSDNIFHNFKINHKTIDLDIRRNDIFKTTKTISKIEKKESDLLQNIDEKDSQHLSRLMGVESRMEIHSFNPEILVQKLQGVPEKNYKLKTMQQSVKNDSIEVETDEKDEYELFNQFMNRTDERYYQDAEDYRNMNLLTKSSKKVMTDDIEQDEKSIRIEKNINDYIDPYDPLSQESITVLKNLRKTYKRDYDYALDLLLKYQEKDRIKVNDIVFSSYNDILRNNGREEIDEMNDRLPEFLRNFVKNMMTREKKKDQDAIIFPREKKNDETQRQYELRIKNLDRAKERRKSIKDQGVEFNSLMEKHLNERLDKIKVDEKIYSQSKTKKIKEIDLSDPILMEKHLNELKKLNEKQHDQSKNTKIKE